MSDDAKKPPVGGFTVGYGRPPAATRFKPGQSGNPKGRPKGARNFRTEIEAALNATVVITENGKRKKVSKRKAAAIQLANQGAQGVPKAIGILLQHDQRSEAAAQAGSAVPEAVSAADRLVMASIIQRIRQAADAPDDAADAAAGGP